MGLGRAEEESDLSDDSHVLKRPTTGNQRESALGDQDVHCRDSVGI